MGVRRVQKVGKSTYTVSLPHEWVKQNRIAPKTEVSIVTLPNGSLKISTVDNQRDEKTKELTIEAKEPDAGDIIRRTLAAYIANYDVIKIDFSKVGFDSQARDKIRKMIKFKMAGGEIIEETSNYMTVQVLLKPHEFPLDRLLLRMAVMARDMISDILKAEKSSDKEFGRSLLLDVVGRDDDVDKMYFMATRWLSSIMEDQSLAQNLNANDFRKALDYRLAFRNTERVADHIVRIASRLLEGASGTPAIWEMLLKQLADSAEIFVRAINAFNNGSIQEANRVVHEARKVVAKEEDAIKQVVSGGYPAKTVASAILIIESIKRISEYGIGISELTFNKCIEIC
ncbi:MAG: PhoU domain-containing protein [Candidatus Verstraetearchaeota archaeon]|nr:PhoU domain-containing protein [Candidatus Verstraetearchaeota archaeon]